jgi:hypothetical protein
MSGKVAYNFLGGIDFGFVMRPNPPEVGMRSLHAPGLVTSRGRRRRNHQAQALKQHHCTLCCSTPDELATLALAVLHVDVAARVLQAAVLERAVDEDPVVKN